MSEEKQIRAEAAAFRRLLSHLDSRKDVQNIDEAKEIVYKMPYADWKEQYQTPMNRSSLKE